MTIEVIEFIQSLRSGFGDTFFNFISFLGEEYVYILLLSIVYFAYDKKMGEFLGLVLFFTGLLNATIKGIFVSQRPFEKYPLRVENLRPETATGYSFPSGHTQNFTAFLFSGAFWFNKKAVIITASILSVLMALSRMYLGVHWLEDVLTSLLLGVITAYVLHKFFIKVKDQDKTLLIINLVILVAFLPFLFLQTKDDLFKGYGLMVGFTVGMYIEKTYIKFTMDVVLWKKAIRVVVGLLIMVLIMVGLGSVFDFLAEEGSTLLNILDMIRYGLIALVGLGVYPFLFKRFNF